MPPRVCLAPGCPNLVRNGTRCPDHAAPTKTAARGYGSQWQALSRQARDAQPWCSDCETTDDLTVDHLRWPAVTLNDVEVVCRSCNSRRGARRRLVSE